MTATTPSSAGCSGGCTNVPPGQFKGPWKTSNHSDHAQGQNADCFVELSKNSCRYLFVPTRLCYNRGTTLQRSGPPVETQKTDKSIYLLLALTTALWGSLYTANKVLLEAVPNFTLLCLRYLLSAAVMTVFQRLRKPDPQGKPRRIQGGDWKYIILFGLGGYVLSVGLQQYGTKLAGASLASLINCMNPIVICFFAVLLLHERMTAKKVVCIASAVLGAVCIVGGDTGGGHILGIALSFGSVLTWSLISVFMRSFTQKYDALTVTTCGIYVAAIATIPLMVYELATTPGVDFLHPKYILVLLYVAVCCTAIPHSLWNYSLSRVEASTCSLFYPVQPLTSMVLGVLLLHEHMTVGYLAGGALIVFGVLYSTLGKEKNG